MKFPPRITHQQRGQPSHHGVQQDGRDGAAVLRSQVRFGVGGVVAEEALDVHGEGVRVLKVVGQHDGPGHDHQLEVKHDADGKQKTFNLHISLFFPFLICRA